MATVRHPQLSAMKKTAGALLLEVCGYAIIKPSDEHPRDRDRNRGSRQRRDRGVFPLWACSMAARRRDASRVHLTLQQGTHLRIELLEGIVVFTVHHVC